MPRSAYLKPLEIKAGDGKLWGMLCPLCSADLRELLLYKTDLFISCVIYNNPFSLQRLL